MVRLLTRPRPGALAIALLLALAACGSGAASTLGGPQAADARLDPTERIVRLHVAINELRDDPDAAGTAVELSRAATWVARAEALTRTKTDPDLRDLLLDTAEGQVTMVRSHAALRRSSRSLQERHPGALPLRDHTGDAPSRPPLPSPAEAHRGDDADASAAPSVTTSAAPTEAP